MSQLTLFETPNSKAPTTKKERLSELMAQFDDLVPEDLQRDVAIQIWFRTEFQPFIAQLSPREREKLLVKCLEELCR